MLARTLLGTSVPIAAVVLATVLSPARAQDDAPASPFRDDQVRALSWRSIGPPNMGGRVTDIDVAPGRRTTWYVATAGGGLWKTTNAGTTWDTLFDDQPVVAIGDVAIAPSNPDVVWVGSGEENARNSVSWGDGVYKSTDGGASFAHAGLGGTFQIGHIAIHPTDADVVYVAALGRLWSKNPDRGVFRTRDGGKTWQKVLFVDDATGCIDVRIDPSDPSIVYACMYERLRDMFDSNDPAVRFGSKAGFFKSADGGDTWRRVDNGLPTCMWGRSGLTVSTSKPGALYMIVETEKSGWATSEKPDAGDGAAGNAYAGINARDADPAGAELTSITADGPASKAGFQVGDVVVAIGATEVEDWNGLRRVIGQAEGGAKVEVKVRRGGETKTIELTYGTRGGDEQPGTRGGNRARYAGSLGGQQPNVQDAQDKADPKAYETGGVFRSDDFGETWRRVNSLTDRPFYYSVIAVDPSNDQSIYSCGVPFFASHDGGAKFDQVQRQIHVDFHAMWIDPHDSEHLLVGCDGGVYETFDRCETWQAIDNMVIGQFYHCDVDASEPYRVYGGLQDNGTWGGPSQSRFREGTVRHDWVTIFGGDGFRAIVDPSDSSTVYATSQNGGIGRVDMARASTGRVQKPSGTRYNWDTPFFVSPHNSRILYFAGDKAARSLDRGRRSEAISDTLSLTERGTATAFAESPLEPGLLYVGTDDGALWRSPDGGKSWQPLHGKLIGMPGPRYVSSIEPSYYEADRVYVTFDGHRSDDFDTHVYVSEDRGETWTSLIANLPDECVHVVREYPRRNAARGGHENLLFLGTEFGCWVSLDRGNEWFRLGSGLPTVPVRDLVVHERDSDLVAATHGRSIWVLDVEPLRELTAEVAKKDVHLFRPERATLWTMRSRGMQGHREWTGTNPSGATTVYLWSKQAPPKDATATVHDITGNQVGTLVVAQEAGLQAMTWDPRGGGGGRGGFGGRGRRVSPIAPGDYAVRYAAGGETLATVPLVVRADPDGTVTPLSNPTENDTERRN